METSKTTLYMYSYAYTWTEWFAMKKDGVFVRYEGKRKEEEEEWEEQGKGSRDRGTNQAMKLIIKFPSGKEGRKRGRGKGRGTRGKGCLSGDIRQQGMQSAHTCLKKFSSYDLTEHGNFSILSQSWMKTSSARNSQTYEYLCCIYIYMYCMCTYVHAKYYHERLFWMHLKK